MDWGLGLEMAYCGACGTPYSVGTRACSRCGRSLSAHTTARSSKPIDVIDSCTRAKVPSLVARGLRPDEQILASFPALVRVSGRRGGTFSRTLVLTTQRLLLARDGLFNKQLDEMSYRSVSGVSLRSGFLASTRAILIVPLGTITVTCRKDDASIIDRVILGGKGGATLVSRGATVMQPPSSAPLIAAVPATIPGPHAGLVAIPFPIATGGIDLDTIDPLAFEELVCRLFERMGYRASLTKASHDGGVDIEVFDPTPIRGGHFLVQCKRYSGAVGAQYVRDLYGVVQHERAMKGILVTTSHFSPDARGFAAGKPLELIDRPQLESLLGAHGFGAPAAGTAPAPYASTPVSSTSMPSSLVPQTGAGNTRVARSRRTGSSWTWLIKGPVYMFAAVCMLAAINGARATFWVGLDIAVITLLASNAWRLRERLPLFGSPRKWKSGLGFAGLVALLFGGLAALPSASGQSRAAAAPVRTQVRRAHPVTRHALHRPSPDVPHGRRVRRRARRPAGRLVRAAPHRSLLVIAPAVRLRHHIAVSASPAHMLKPMVATSPAASPTATGGYEGIQATAGILARTAKDATVRVTLINTSDKPFSFMWQMFYIHAPNGYEWGYSGGPTGTLSDGLLQSVQPGQSVTGDVSMRGDSELVEPDSVAPPAPGYDTRVTVWWWPVKGVTIPLPTT